MPNRQGVARIDVQINPDAATALDDLAGGRENRTTFVRHLIENLLVKKGKHFTPWVDLRHRLPRSSPPLKGADAKSLVTSIENDAVSPAELEKRAESSRARVANLLLPLNKREKVSKTKTSKKVAKKK